MTLEEKRQLYRDACKVVVHLADAISETHKTLENHDPNRS